MKKSVLRLIALALVTIMVAAAFIGCSPENEPNPYTDEYTGDVIYVGNTAGTTGALAAIGGPFNLGIEAAFKAFNDAGGFNGKTVALKHYDDGGVAADSATLMEKLIHEDNVFAIVGNFGSNSVAANLSILKENNIPMVYAAAGNEILFNENATATEDKVIFPVQPLNKTEGRSLILRAFAAAPIGLGATKVGVISNSNEASQSMLAGIKAEAATLADAKKNNIVYQEVASDDPTAAINALKQAGCDAVIVTTIGADFTTAIAKMVDAACTWKVLTSYNNSSAAIFNTESLEIGGVTYKVMNTTYATALASMQIFAQGWINITDNNATSTDPAVLATAYKYKGKLVPFYTALGQTIDDPLTPEVDQTKFGFTEPYWKVAEAIYDYAKAAGKSDADAFAMSYDSYALAGYIAGNMFCQALTEMKAQNKTLSRENLVSILESKEFQVAMADTISFANGARVGVDAFSLTYFYGYNGMAVSGTVTNGVSSIADIKAAIPQ